MVSCERILTCCNDVDVTERESVEIIFKEKKKKRSRATGTVNGKWLDHSDIYAIIHTKRFFFFLNGTRRFFFSFLLLLLLNTQKLNSHLRKSKFIVTRGSFYLFYRLRWKVWDEIFSWSACVFGFSALWIERNCCHDQSQQLIFFWWPKLKNCHVGKPQFPLIFFFNINRRLSWLQFFSHFTTK